MIDALFVASCVMVAGWAIWACLDRRVQDGIIGKLSLSGIALGALSQAWCLSGAHIGQALMMISMAIAGAWHFLRIATPRRKLMPEKRQG